MTSFLIFPAVLPLRLTFADGYRLQASASVVGTNDLLTATHVLYQPQHGGWATGLALLGTQVAADGQIGLTGEATPIDGWQVWANPQQVYADNDPATLTLGESQYDVALIGVNRLLDRTGLTLADHAVALQGSGLGYAGGQHLSGIDTGLQHGQDGYSVWGSTDSQLGTGSSGGPLLDESGQLIGVNSAGTPGSATWWADIGPFLPQITAQMQANDGLLQATGPFQTGPLQISTGTTLPELPPTGQETVGPQLPNALTVGGEFRVNSTTANDQYAPAVSALRDGGYVVTWQSDGQDGSGFGIYAQRYASNGSAMGGEARVNSTTQDHQQNPAVSALADGGYVVTWDSNGQDGSGYGIYAQRYASNGSTLGGEFRVNSTTQGDQSHPAVSTLADGGYVVTWTSDDGSDWGIYAQRYASTGSTVGGEFRVNSFTTNFQYASAVAALADGGYVVTWQSYGQDGSGYGIYAQRYASSGSTVGGEFRVNSTTTGDQYDPAITALADGGYLVTWESYGQDGSGADIYAQRYASNGNVVGGEFRVNSTTTGIQSDPACTALTDGGYVVTWESKLQDGSGYGIYAQGYASSGNAVGEEFRVNDFTANDQYASAVAALVDGSYVVTWQSSGQDGSGYGIYAQRFSSSIPVTPSFSIRASYPSFNEGSGGGTTPVPLEITRSGDTSNSSSVEWTIVPGSADGGDFSGSTFGNVTFAAGETSKTIQIQVNKDSNAEANETFSVQLKNPVNATLSGSSASMTIVNDDSGQGGDGSSATQAEGVLYRFAKLNGNYFYTANPAEIQSIQDNYLDSMRFEGYAFNCSPGSGKPVYRYALLDNGGGYFYTADAGERQYVAQHPEKFRAEIVDGSGVQQPAFYAAADSDSGSTPVYRLKNGQGGYLFTANESEKNAAASMYGYTYEQIAFRVPAAGTPAGFVLAAGLEGPFAHENATLNSANTVSGGSLKYQVIRIGDISGPASVQWSVKGSGNANPADPDDFAGGAYPGGTLSFAANEAGKIITVQFNGDNVYGTDEIFSVTLSNPQGEQILVGSMAGKIVNDDQKAAKDGYQESAYDGLIHIAGQPQQDAWLAGGEAVAVEGWWFY